MRHPSRLTAAAVSSFALLALLATSRTAHADDAPLGAPPAVSVTSRAAIDAPPADAVTDDAPRADFKPLTLSLNPLSLVVGRISANVEYLPLAHHAIVANPFFQSISVSSDSEKTQYSNFGAEAGYHDYTGKRGANGFFVGPSLLVMTARSSVTPSGTGASNVTDSFFSYGAALDVGGQHGLSCAYGGDVCTCVNTGQNSAEWSCLGAFDSGGSADGGVADGDAATPDCVYNDGGSQIDAAGRFRGSCAGGCPAGTICAVEIGGVAGGGGEYCAPIVDRCRNDLSCACLASCVCGSAYGRAERCATAANDGGEVVQCDNGIR